MPYTDVFIFPDGRMGIDVNIAYIMAEESQYRLYGMPPVEEAVLQGKKLEKILFKQGLEGDQFRRLLSEVEKAGGRIDAVYYSTGMDCSDPMRKPNPGMIFKAVGDRPQTDLKRSIMAGDKDSDMQCAANAGVRGERISEHFTLEDLASRLIDE